jgi:nucleoid-associated protein YgaU
MMTEQTKGAVGKGLALAGGAVAAVFVLIGALFTARMAPPPQTADPEPAPTPVAQAPATDAPSATDTAADQASAPETATASPEAAATDAPAGTETAAVDAADATDADTADQTSLPADSATQTVPADDTATEDTATEDTAAVAPADAAQPAATAQQAAPAADPAPIPSFDTVRLAPDGEALVAGRGLPGRTVDVLLDGVAVGSAMTGGDGAFVAFLSLPPSDMPRVLTLQIAGDGAAIVSGQQVIIAPVAAAAAAAVADAALGTNNGATTMANTGTSDPSQTASTPAATDTPGSAPALLLADANGLRVLQPATPADPGDITGIALDVISYTAEGDVLLQGRATATQTVLAYLDNRPVTSVPVGADGIWSTGLPGVRPGIYTLRLDEVDATGKVLSRIETPFKREDRAEVAAIAAATAPAAQTDTAPAAAPAETGASATTATAASTQGATTATADASATPQSQSTATVRVVTVQPGNTLWAIARENYGEGPLFVRLFEANRDRIRDPDLIYPGQIFEIPD